ncbi:glycosyltransferase [Streptomyces sp. H10-C2]|uniref:glycosyltransferase n=1 Tax=unclassified Streptomyces TaxID=2593676 RepID=UPI0024B8DB8F|nr:MULTISPECIES: glycosyltransferase [unclassified Streptomyces]MDJ0342631.1 glycosyltransferase [Streptomyces sp. PH10-H1]MDJ0368515.1 glycosyltransferase [Streptomyces sp. H10-C2]
MLVGVCDFPGSYAFPPAGYGGIERWLWAVAVGARAAGADVHLLGPGWLADLEPDWVRKPDRLEDITAGSLAERALRSAGYDLLVVGHEYPSLPAWTRTWNALECDVATFQHSPVFQHTSTAFDGARSRLYCYSPEMIERYADHQPVPELAVHLGLDEDEPPAVAGSDLVWLGRIDEEKAPHIAVRAAQMLGRRIQIVGPVFDEAYVRHHERLFSASHVKWVGELGGPAKTAAIRDASAFVYTYARTYVEAGAAVFGESLRAGTPMAALTWRGGTCAEAALCDQTGAITVGDPDLDDETAAGLLARAIEEAEDLDHTQVQEIGMQRFDPARHFTAMSTRPC